MTKKEAIVNYISEMNIDMLFLVLENDISFMNLYMEDFLEKLQEIFLECKSRDLVRFSKVIKGISNDSETKGIEGYKFITSDKTSLTLLFEEDNNEIIEIYNCSAFKTYQNCEETIPIFISIYEDEKVGYLPTFENIILTKKIDIFFFQYDDFKNTATPIKVVDNWYNSIKEVYDDLNLFEYLDFKFYNDFSELVVRNMFINTIVENAEISKKALKEYKKINIENEFEIAEWLLKYKNIKSVFSHNFKNDNWKRNNLITHKEDKSIILDIINYKSSIIFDEIYNKHYSIPENYILESF